MKSRELLDYIRKNGIKVEFRDGKLSATPREKVVPLANDFSEHRKILSLRARGCFVDWQGVARKVRDECEKRFCATCPDWQPEFDDEGHLTGLCVSRVVSEVKLSDVMFRRKGVSK